MQARLFQAQRMAQKLRDSCQQLGFEVASSLDHLHDDLHDLEVLQVSLGALADVHARCCVAALVCSLLPHNPGKLGGWVGGWVKLHIIKPRAMGEGMLDGCEAFQIAAWMFKGTGVCGSLLHMRVCMYVLNIRRRQARRSRSDWPRLQRWTRKR